MHAHVRVAIIGSNRIEAAAYSILLVAECGWDVEIFGAADSGHGLGALARYDPSIIVASQAAVAAWSKAQAVAIGLTRPILELVRRPCDWCPFLRTEAEVPIATLPTAVQSRPCDAARQATPEQACWNIVAAECGAETLMNAITATLAKERYVDTIVIDRHKEATGVDERISSLTRRECEVARLVCEGLSYEQIAGKLFITTGTVRTHVTGLFEELACCSRSQVTAFIASGIAPAAKSAKRPSNNARRTPLADAKYTKQ
jgi:DNA-binding CsgD family transcriptional regulator